MILCAANCPVIIFSLHETYHLDMLWVWLIMLLTVTLGEMMSLLLQSILTVMWFFLTILWLRQEKIENGVTGADRIFDKELNTNKKLQRYKYSNEFSNKICKQFLNIHWQSFIKQLTGRQYILVNTAFSLSRSVAMILTCGGRFIPDTPNIILNITTNTSLSAFLSVKISQQIPHAL